MRTQSSDTSPEIEQIQIELLRKASLSKHFAIVEVIFPWFRGVSKHANPVAHKQQGSDTLTMSGAAVGCRRPRSTQR